MSTLVSNLELIRRIPMFSMLTTAQAAFIGNAIVKSRFQRGDPIVEQGKKADALFVLITGRAHVVSSDQRGREIILATMQPGDYLGEMSLIDGEPHSATVRAEIQTDVLALGRLEFARCLSENSSVAYAVMKGLAQRLRQADRKIESLALMDVYGRVAHALLESSCKDRHGDVVISEKISRQDLANTVGASREMVSRVMRDLEERKFIETRMDGSTLINEHLNSI